MENHSFISVFDEMTNLLESKDKKTIFKLFEYMVSTCNVVENNQCKMMKNKILISMGYVNRNIVTINCNVGSMLFTVNLGKAIVKITFNRRAVKIACNRPMAYAIVWTCLNDKFGCDIAKNIFSFIKKPLNLNNDKLCSKIIKPPRIYRIAIKNYYAALNDNINIIADMYKSQYGTCMQEDEFPQNCEKFMYFVINKCDGIDANIHEFIIIRIRSIISFMKKKGF